MEDIKPPVPMKNVGFYIKLRTKLRLRRYCESRHIAMSGFVDDAIVAALDKVEKNEPVEF